MKAKTKGYNMRNNKITTAEYENLKSKQKELENQLLAIKTYENDLKKMEKLIASDKYDKALDFCESKTKMSHYDFNNFVKTVE